MDVTSPLWSGKKQQQEETRNAAKRNRLEIILLGLHATSINNDKNQADIFAHHSFVNFKGMRKGGIILHIKQRDLHKRSFNWEVGMMQVYKLEMEAAQAVEKKPFFIT